MEEVVQASDIHEAPALEGIETLNLPWAVCTMSILLSDAASSLENPLPSTLETLQVRGYISVDPHLTDRGRYLWSLASRLSNMVASPCACGLPWPRIC
jgi:hypothetical protein